MSGALSLGLEFRARESDSTAHREEADARQVMVGRSPSLLGAIDTARRLASIPLPLLIVGETGTGKELLAQYIHRLSRRQGPLVDVDCGAIPEDLFESILFGHRRGAFTGAVEHVEGIIERSHRGTLFLDELGSLPLRSQAKLLRVIETGEVRRLGGTRSQHVDFRLLATLQENGSDPVAEGRFRLDLMQRVAGAVIRVPPLAERSGDIVLLARHFAGRSGLRLERQAEEHLLSRAWPGNVRELKWAVERAVMFATDGVIGSLALEEALSLSPSRLLCRGGMAPPSRLVELRAVCRAHRGNPEPIARAMGIGRSTLYRWLKEAGMELRHFKQPGAVEALSTATH
jgi:DNA-binding NtrC family response regulator